MLPFPSSNAVGVCFGRRVAVLALAVFGLLATVPALAAEAPAAPAAARRPNIIFIFSDDHATSAISAYGSKLIDTPNIDRIAREGAIFRN
jgi:N-acetylglucosamine-6-sulfatase